jgi:molybdate transport system ATP-binding protein
MELDVSFRKSLTAANRRVDIDVRFASRARRLVLFGPSGAGKSLTLQAIAGLIAPDAGRIAFGGEVWFDAESRTERPARERGVGLMFQDYALFPHLTVAENVGATHARGWPRRMDAAAQREVDCLLHTFGLRPLADSYPSQLSGGQRQRTALARALAGSPRLLLLDEPFASLDETLRRSARNELLALQAQCDVPMVVITHDPRDVDALAQDVVALDAGRVVTMPDAAPKITVRAIDGVPTPL